MEDVRAVEEWPIQDSAPIPSRHWFVPLALMRRDTHTNNYVGLQAMQQLAGINVLVCFS